MLISKRNKQMLKHRKFKKVKTNQLMASSTNIDDIINNSETINDVLEKIQPNTSYDLNDFKQEEVMEQVQNTQENKNSQEQNISSFYKVDDWYSRHNLGTRLAMIVFLGMYIFSIYFGMSIDIITTTGYLAFFTFLVITLGDNAISKIGDIIKSIKGK